jgi:hypothetical protein
MFWAGYQMSSSAEESHPSAEPSFSLGRLVQFWTKVLSGNLLILAGALQQFCPVQN